MRKSFTLIELIFVLVIIAILSSLALTRFFALQNRAQEQVALSFASTLTRTTGNTLWSKSMAVGGQGSIKNDNDGNNSAFYGNSLEVYVTIPKYFDRTSVNFANCVSGSGAAAPFIKKNSSTGGEYNIFCRDGNQTDAPKFVAAKENSYNF